jgi:hypothetical protein
MIDRHKIHRIVEYIKLFEFEFEISDVEENLDNVLGNYGLLEIDLTAEEYKLLKNELLPLAEEYEFSEVSRLALQEESLISQIQDPAIV